jgi:hypothetical protein
VNVLAPTARSLVLTGDDSYRLVLELVEPRYVYVFEQRPTGTLALLYPNQAYSAVPNPVLPGQVTYLPAEPNGFFHEGEAGRFRLYVVAAEQSAPELETLYARYARQGTRLVRRTRLARLQEQLDAQSSRLTEGVSGYRLEFEVR